ncbi:MULTISPECIES: helix-turn-helix transcriptional regulator [unclassified Rhizobium]|uniref:helix-turn-helix transcriptional regulator n=1 Tax=unclassified Rhizobium TaxID=2613769 RepID=UPI000714C031|nr:MULTISPECIES: LuxR family transcriptional regulator [unclassified Rhizobium]KQS98145.1 transcriptional regulator [Rhizobium sp. Leaf386]KQT00408.1 transcriptional regulator [Rhizobium sp. Leaf391]KQT97411.1 transcriptional regulator [Rhizobium sp. Leaf453]
MTDQQAFFDLLDIMENEKLVEPTRFFDLMRGTFSIANLLYLDADVFPAGLAIHRLHHTLGANSLRAYMDAGFQRIDPVLKMAIGGVRPVDWATARKLHPESEPLFATAADLGHKLDGVTLPLPTPTRRLAFLAIQADMPTEEWPAYKRCHLRDFQILANLFHASLLENDNRIQLSDHCGKSLTHRETEVLSWAAAGKSYWEIGTILGISERTVRFFMTNARRKLNVVSNSQAVAQAVRRDLISTL